MYSSRVLASVLLALVLIAGAAPRSAAADNFPETIALPDGWLPEGIVTGRGPVVYSGSRANGAIYAADLRTGTGQVLVQGAAGAVAVGMAFDARTNYLFVAGGPTGRGSVYDAGTGELVVAYQLAGGGATFVNDVIVTRDAAYFTDSSRAAIYRVPLGIGGTVPGEGNFETIALGGDYQHVTGFNLNGIEATADGKNLVAVHSALGLLYRIDPATGIATTIDLGGASLTAGDGLLLRGRTLYVVRNRLNEVVVLDLAPDTLSGIVTDVLSSPNFDIPTTIAGLGSRLYVVNARFSTPPTPQTTYDIVRVPH